MIKFFRKIRQSLLTENRFSKYLLYAVGEILLVVIGILIALQVNEWNENRKNKFEEYRILVNLKAEIQDNLKSLEASISKRDRQINAVKALLQLVDEQPETPKPFSVDSLIGLCRYIPNFEARSGVIEEILNSGKLNLLESEQLRKLLSNWYGDLEDLKRKEDGLEDIIVFQLNPYLTRKHTLRNSDNIIILSLWKNNRYMERDWLNKKSSGYTVDYDALLSDPQFESLLSLIKLWTISGQITSRELKDKIKNTLSTIEENISLTTVK
jgi:hypothetical protein